MLNTATVAIASLLSLSLSMASTPLIEPDNTPRGETVLEPIRYSVPSIPRFGSILLEAHPLDTDRVLLTGAVVDFGTRPTGSSPLPLVIADLADNSKSFRGGFHPGVEKVSVSGATAAVLTSTASRGEWVRRLWVVDLETWKATELLETPATRAGRDRIVRSASVSSDGNRLLVSFFSRDGFALAQDWELYNVATGDFTHLVRNSGRTDILQWAPDGRSLLQSRVPGYSGRVSTVLDRIWLDGVVPEHVGHFFGEHFSLGRVSPDGDHTLIDIDPGRNMFNRRTAIMELSTETIVELADDRARDGRGARWSFQGDRFAIIAGEFRPLDPEPSHIFEVGLDGQTLRHWEFDDHQITDVFWMPGRDDPYAVTARGEIYLLHGDGDNTYRRVWSIHRSPLRNP